MERLPCRRRSVLYVPASNIRAMARLSGLDCDAAIYDLEDAVAPEGKSEARSNLLEHFAAADVPAGRERVIRINAQAGIPVGEDLEVAVRCRPDAVLLPKVEAPDILTAARKALDDRGCRYVRLWAMVETPLGIVDLRNILATASSADVRLDVLVAGVNDLAKETNVPLPAGRGTIDHWLATVVLHARAFGLDVLDGVFNDFQDDAGFENECKRAASAGFDGKTLVHPRQIERANAAFSPTPEAMRQAHMIVEAFGSPENAGKGVLVVEGRMTERLHLEMANRLIARFAS